MTCKIRPDPPRRGYPGAGRAPWPIRFFAELGPNRITGAADDDPFGISTYSVAGAAFNPRLLRWLGWATAVILTVAMVGMFVTL